ncbi:MAG: isoaspartyl peptidase/L-asparaginase, partial [Acidobacteria bacterium]|nr:isoaspartyl peptidase/L-asparaginase [Acidobacteriota bacterium]
ARLVLERSPHMMLVGSGAELFAVENGVQLCDPAELVIRREVELWARNQQQTAADGGVGTVGAVALDAQGNLAAGTSTGGPAYKFPGRVGDSPIIGCGCYADNLSGAVSTTGDGEPMMKVVMAKMASDFLARGLDPQGAAEEALAVLSKRTRGTAGLILVDPQGRVGAAFTTPRMAHAFRTSELAEPLVRI